MSKYKNADKLIGNIDFPKLKEQKLQLLETIDSLEKQNKKDEVELLSGILGLVDNIQDYAVDILGEDEKEVFNLSTEEDE